MENELWKMMISNAQDYLSSTTEVERETGRVVTAMQISEVLAVCTGKLKEDIILELALSNK
jgi:hypothetical protein